MYVHRWMAFNETCISFILPFLFFVILVLFNMFDRGKKGIIDEEDLIFIVHKLFADIFSTAKIINVVNMMLMEMDTSHTNQILFEDFCRAWEIFDMEQHLVTRIPQ